MLNTDFISAEQRTLRAPHGNLGEFAIVATAALTAQSFANEAPVLLSTAIPSKIFKPEMTIAWVELDVVYGGSDLPEILISRELHKRDELEFFELVELTFGDVDCFQNWPTRQEVRAERAVRLTDGLSLAAFADDSLGGGISFPVCSGHVSVAFCVGNGFLTMLESLAPAGYTKSPHSIKLAIHLRMIGPPLR